MLFLYRNAECVILGRNQVRELATGRPSLLAALIVSLPTALVTRTPRIRTLGRRSISRSSSNAGFRSSVGGAVVEPFTMCVSVAHSFAIVTYLVADPFTHGLLL